MLYPDAAMRRAVSHAVIHESSRGWRLDKLKQSHKIDLVVALSMAALAAVKGQSESSYNFWWPLGRSEAGEPQQNDEQPTTQPRPMGIPVITN